MDSTASKTLRSLLGQMQSEPTLTIMAKKRPSKSSAEAYPTFLYKISPVLSVQQSPSMVQTPTSSKNTTTSGMSSNITSISNSITLEEMGLRRTRTVIPNSVKVQIARVANQIPRMTQGEIAQMFGIDRTTVSKILKRKREYLGSDDSPTRAKYTCLAQDRGTNEADYNESHARRVPNILSTSKNKSPKENSCPGGNKIPKQQTQVATSKPEEEMVTEIKEEVTEIDDSEALSREINNLDKFRDQQKMIEEANKQRKALLSKTLTERQRKAREEAQKLSHIQKELQLLDNRLSADVTLIRSRIESSSKDYLEAQRRYDRAEREFIEAKMDLQKKSELKEQLTEHLYTIIHQNELRKAEKLSQLMNELQMENESEGNGVQLSSLPPLSAFNAMGLSTLTKIQSNDPSALGSSSTKTTVKSSESNKAEKHNTTCESSNLAEENTNNSLCHIMTESQNTTDDSANSSTTAEKRQGQVGRKQENGEPPSQLETMPDLASSTEKEKSVPTSWTLDVIIKQEPEENG
ncbi:uncharacterized protein LOC111123221 isoform X2 [Crassostrea virginica]